MRYISHMYFLLHHSRGALMVDAGNRQDVEFWSQRQLGSSSGLVFVLELDEQLEHGIETRIASLPPCHTQSGCQAKLSMMADSVQRLGAVWAEVLRSEDWFRPMEFRNQHASVH